MNPNWTAIRHSQMVHVATHAMSSNVFSPLFTQAWKLLPGYFLFLLSINTETNTYIVGIYMEFRNSRNINDNIKVLRTLGGKVAWDPR